MKKLGILLLLFALVSCDNVDRVDRGDAETKTEWVETSGASSYWFVVVQKKGGFGAVTMNIVVKQNHKYFSEEELKAEFKDDVFIMNLVEISKETYEHNK